MKSTSLTVFRVLGAVLAAAIGPAFILTPWISLFPPSSRILDQILITAVLAAVCGYLLRTWWSLLAVPVLFLLGVAAAWYCETIIIGSRPGSSFTLRGQLGFVGYGLYLSAYFFLVPVLIGAAVGTGLAKWLAHEVMVRRLRKGGGEGR